MVGATARARRRRRAARERAELAGHIIPTGAPGRLLQMQRTAGNKAVTELVQREVAIQRDGASELAKVEKKKFGQWIGKVADLVSSGHLWLKKGRAFELRGGMRTIEVRVWVKSGKGKNTREVGEFVVHYHPGASGASVGSAYASPMHLKPDKKSVYRIYAESIPAAIKSSVPTLKQIRTQFGRA